ncbi:hypothetical protein [Cupriavidus sp. TMH.W2]|uniref:hypothetical protein n=1 Tax=Cupriavidus sp. TMH.W2 TaxID=3434465 RepID=UPI003D7840F1
MSAVDARKDLLEGGSGGVSPGFERPTALDLGRQQRNLLLMRPLFEFALKSRRADGNEALWAGLDTNYLVLALLVFVMDGGALGMGRTFAEIITYVAETAQRMKPSLVEEQARTIAREVLDTVHNAENKTQQFSFDYFDAISGETRAHSFFLLRYERSDEDDEYYFRVSDEGFLVYLGMLDFGAADMQALMEKMLHEFIRRGNIDQAMEASQRALYEGRRYFEQISTQLLRAHRVPDVVRWQEDLAPSLDQARSHIDARMEEEHQLLQAVTDSLNNTSDARTRDKFVRLRETVEGGLTTTGRLLQLVGEAGKRYRDAARSLFRTRRRHRLPNVEEVVLPELSDLPTATLANFADVHGHALFGVGLPKLYHLEQMFATLLTPQSQSVEASAVVGDLVPLEGSAPRFSKAEVELAESFLRRHFGERSETDIAKILAHAEEEKLGRTVQEYMTFMMYRAFSRDESPFPVDASTDGRFETSLVAGTKLVFVGRDQNES